MQTPTKTTSIQSSSLDARIESPLLCIEGEGKQGFVHDTYKDFFLAKYFATLFEEQKIQLIPFFEVAGIYGSLEDSTKDEKRQKLNKLLTLCDTLKFYVNLTRDGSFIRPLLEAGFDFKKEDYSFFTGYIQLVLVSGECSTQCEQQGLDEKEIRELAKELIGYCHAYFDAFPSAPERSINILVDLVKKYDFVLDMLIDSAAEYHSTACRDDGSPYNPNPFDVLAIIAKENKKAKEYLESFFTTKNSCYGYYRRWVFSWESQQLLSKVFPEVKNEKN